MSGNKCSGKKEKRKKESKQGLEKKREASDEPSLTEPCVLTSKKLLLCKPRVCVYVCMCYCSSSLPLFFLICICNKVDKIRQTRARERRREEGGERKREIQQMVDLARRPPSPSPHTSCKKAVWRERRPPKHLPHIDESQSRPGRRNGPRPMLAIA